MHNKKPNMEALDNLDAPQTDAVFVLRPQLKKYLYNVTLCNEITDPHLLKMYRFIRNQLAGSVGEKSHVVLAILIERIARLFVYLEKMDKELMKEDYPAISKEEKKTKLQDYNLVQTELRKLIEAFVNIKAASEQKPQRKVLEEIRKKIEF